MGFLASRTTFGRQLGEVADLTAKKMKVAQMFNTPKQLHSSTSAEAVYGVKCSALFGVLDPNTLSLKIAQCSLFEDLKECYATFPKSGTMLNGKVYQQKHLDTHIKEKDCIALLTPTASDGMRKSFKLQSLIKRYQKHPVGNLAEQLAGQYETKITANFCETMMGFPLSWTELKPVETQ